MFLPISKVRRTFNSQIRQNIFKLQLEIMKVNLQNSKSYMNIHVLYAIAVIINYKNKWIPKSQRDHRNNNTFVSRIIKYQSTRTMLPHVSSIRFIFAIFSHLLLHFLILFLLPFLETKNQTNKSNLNRD